MADTRIECLFRSTSKVLFLNFSNIIITTESGKYKIKFLKHYPLLNLDKPVKYPLFI